jgi:hypothetical protein
VVISDRPPRKRVHDPAAPAEDSGERGSPPRRLLACAACERTRRNGCLSAVEECDVAFVICRLTVL